MASNFVLFNATERRNQALWGGVLATALLFVVAVLLPENFPDAVIPGVYTVAIHQFAKRTQGADFAAFISAGGVRYSHWRVVGVGILCFVGVFFALFASLFLLPDSWLEQGAAG